MEREKKKLSTMERIKAYFKKSKKQKVPVKKAGGQGLIPLQVINQAAKAGAALQAARVAKAGAGTNAGALAQGSIPPVAAAPAPAAAAPAPAAAAPAPAAAAPAPAAAAPAPAAAAPAPAAAAPAPVAAGAVAAAVDPAVAAAAGAVPAAAGGAPVAAGAAPAVVDPAVAAAKAAEEEAAKEAAKAAEAARIKAIMEADYDQVNMELQSPANNDVDHAKSRPAIAQEPVLHGNKSMSDTLAELDQATVTQEVQGIYAKLHEDVEKYNKVMQGEKILYEDCRALLSGIQLQARAIAEHEHADASLKSVASSIAEERVPGELVSIAPQILSIDLKTRPEAEGAGGKIARHLMSFCIHVKYPNLPICYNDGSLGGVHLGYWEEILMKYNFKSNQFMGTSKINTNIENGVGGFIKGWNNIYDFLPGSVTFNPTEEHKQELGAQYGADRDMSGLNNIMKEGAAGTLHGERDLIFLDRPGIGYQKMTPRNMNQERNFTDRTLNFRVAVNNDAGQRKELFCTQSIVINNSNVISLLMNHGVGAAGVNISGSQDMQEGGGIAIFPWQRHIPQEAMAELSGFVQSVLAGTAQPFDQLEYNEARNQAGKPPATPGQPIRDGEEDEKDENKVWEGDKSPYGDIVKGASNGAGAIGLARPRNGDQSYQMSIGVEDWMLVAILNAGRLTHLYYSDGKATQYTGRHEKQDGNHYQMNMRSYYEIPVEAYYDNTLQKIVGEQAAPKQTAPAPAVAGGAPQQPPAQPTSALQVLGYLPVSVDKLTLKKFRWDSEYQKIGKLVMKYNASLSGSAEGALAVRQELSQAAVAYLHKHSFSGRSKADRQEKLAELIMELTMTSGAKMKAINNLNMAMEDQLTIDKSGDKNSGIARGIRNIKNFYTRAIDEEGEVVARTAPTATEDFIASPALRAVAISTFSLLEMQEEPDGFRRNAATFKGTSTNPLVDEQGRGYSTVGFKTQSLGPKNTEREDHAVLGSAIHEMTHTADDNVYENPFTLGIDMSRSKEEIKAEMQHRLQNLSHLRKKYTKLNKETGLYADTDKGVGELNDRITYGGLQDKQRILYTGNTMKKRQDEMMSPFTGETQAAAQRVSYDKMDKVRRMADADEELNLTAFNEYDATMPQMMLYMEARGEDKTHPELYRKIRAMALETTVQRMNANDAKKLKK